MANVLDERASSGRLNDTQRMLIEQRVSNDKPSTGVAYLLWLLLWPFGAHRFYLGRTGTAVVMLVLSITVIGLLVSGFWAFVDLFLIPSMARNKMDNIRQRLTMEAIAQS